MDTTATAKQVSYIESLRNQLAAVLEDLQRIEAGSKVDDELMDTIDMIAAIMDGLKDETHGD